jgi:hypothetical protein
MLQRNIDCKRFVRGVAGRINELRYLKTFYSLLTVPHPMSVLTLALQQ